MLTLCDWKKFDGKMNYKFKVIVFYKIIRTSLRKTGLKL
jgi:hypothetical protein